MKKIAIALLSLLLFLLSFDEMMAKVVIENSYIGPFSSISYDCKITNSELEYSIIMEQCRIIDVESRIERSILGKNVEITKGKCRPKTNRFIIGDQGSITLI